MPDRYVEAELDDEEIYVVRDTRTGRVGYVVIPFVDAYWSVHLGDLSRILSGYKLPVSVGELAAATR
ncbi:MAG: hypothetical protein HQL37_14660 [Alphaproteobacteria bacterium]|nr:hypothetical protein [Alphaproteobacteria bacterium]